MAKFEGFSLELLHFLSDLKTNNTRDWFQKNKSRYESELLNPALAFIQAMETPLKKVSPHFVAVPKKVGGSLMRIYRDTRFANDKRPYKTNVGIHFRHEHGKDVHAPGFYLHIEPDEVFLGAGIWHPASDTLASIRTAIDEDAKGWKRAKSAKAFSKDFTLSGDSLKRPPRGYDAQHPMLEDMKRKDFIGVCTMETDELFSASLVKVVADKFKASKPFVKFLCDAIRVDF